MTAAAILKLLMRRYSADWFCVPECKFGPTYSRDVTAGRRMDLWAMRRRWSGLHTLAVEIKVSRADFLRDQKWQLYAAHVAQFYFCAPAGMIKPTELQPGVGLLEVFKTGTGIREKVAAKFPPRMVEALIQPMRHALMSRVKLQRAEVQCCQCGGCVIGPMCGRCRRKLEEIHAAARVAEGQ